MCLTVAEYCRQRGKFCCEDQEKGFISFIELEAAHLTHNDTNQLSSLGVSLTWAICHEMGHNLGLGHSGDRSALMYPSGIGQDESRLGRDDWSGITHLYRGKNGMVSLLEYFFSLLFS